MKVNHGSRIDNVDSYTYIVINELKCFLVKSSKQHFLPMCM